MTKREEVVAEAISWLSTPYHRHARIKGVGVDCAQLPIAVYSAVGLMPEVDPGYAHDWHLHHSEELYVGWVLKFAEEITEAELRAGDLVLWKYGRTFSHGAIVTAWPEIIHSYINRGVELGDASRDEELRTRHKRYFTMRGI
jgi:cell wall-associated NlpC family hydrolase